MARTRFRGGLQPRHVLASNGSDIRQPKNPGDAPPIPAEPPGGRWSLETYPLAIPASITDENDDTTERTP